jgi:hypothetical protein
MSPVNISLKPAGVIDRPKATFANASAWLKKPRRYGDVEPLGY